jgi:hypothetical protein
MSIRFVENETRVSGNRAEYLLQADKLHELTAPDATELVIKAAADAGLQNPGVSSASGTYPVDEKGESDADLLTGKRGPVAGYQRHFVLLGRL